jgi:hypothetical protein
MDKEIKLYKVVLTITFVVFLVGVVMLEDSFIDDSLGKTIFLLGFSLSSIGLIKIL